jgi:hypothetical protein
LAPFWGQKFNAGSPDDCGRFNSAVGALGSMRAGGVSAPEPENWIPISRTAQTVTGRVTFTPGKITFQNGKSLMLARGDQMLFRPKTKKKKMMADLYKVTSPGDPVLKKVISYARGNPSPT